MKLVDIISEYYYLKDDIGFTAWCPRNGWKMLARQVPLEQARKIANNRLCVGGKITENI